MYGEKLELLEKVSSWIDEQENTLFCENMPYK